MKIETLDVQGFVPAMHGMRSPKDSWARNDTVVNTDGNVVIGPNDQDLSMRLQKAGPEHCKHLRMIMVWADIAAPLYWWKQADCYRNGVEKISTSTMHTLLKDPFKMTDFCFDALPGYKIEPEQFVPPIDESTEVWKEWQGYQFSNQGRMRNSNGKEIFGVLHNDGYRFVWFHGKIVPMHRLIAHVFCDGYEDGLVIDHIDGNKQNNRADNLEWVTQKENIRRSRENHQQPTITKTYTGKLTEEQREEIKACADSGLYSQREIGKMFGVSHSTICSILNGRYKYTGGHPNLYEEFAKPLIAELNRLREDWALEDDPDEKRVIWESIIRILPESFIQKRTVMFSYAALRNIVRQRANHKLREWHVFVDWVHTLPYADELIFDKEAGNDGIAL